MLLPVHAPFEGLLIVTVGGVGSPPPLLTVTVTAAVAIRPAASVTVRYRESLAYGTPVVFREAGAMLPATLWLESVVALSCLSRNCVGEPCALLAPMLTV